jgi:phosphotransferase system HPr-like phosphotransfer protein
MTLAASKGAELEITIDGADEIEACEDLTQLVKERFGETE